ncbi:ribonuclease H-like domain-containing protein, partial [Tanacetum coccineum]
MIDFTPNSIVSRCLMLCVDEIPLLFLVEIENLEMKKSESCNKCLDLEAKLVKRKNMVERDKDKSCNNQNALEIQEYFKNNNLKAQLQAKDTTICKLKEHIKSMRENIKEEKVKQEMDVIETINIELEHIYGNADLKGQIQEKVFVTKALQNELKRLKGKNVLDNATTIALGMFKLDLDPLAPSKSSTNKVKSGHTGAYSTYTPSTSSNNIPEREVPAGFADEVIYSLFAKQSEDLDLLHEDLEQIDDMDIEEMDINWQIAMIAIRMKKFYKKTGRRVRIDGNKPVGFDKKKLECFKCHNTSHFTRECPSKGTNDGKKRDSFYQDQGARKKEHNQNCLLTMDDGVVNWGEHTQEEVETNQALMAISSNNEVSLCSKTCINSYNKLKALCDEQTNQLGEQEVKILAYDQAVKKLEAQVKIVDAWKDSSKNLWRLVDSGMSSTSKVGLGYEIKSNDEVLSYKEEMNSTVFNCTAEDFIDKPLYIRFSKTDSFKGVPHPLSGDYTPKPQQEIDESLYVYGKKGPQKPEISDSDNTSNEHSTCQSNDSEGSFGNPSEHSSESESESISVTESKEVEPNEKVVTESKEVEPSCVTHVKTPRQQIKNQETPKVNRKNYDEMMGRELGEGYSFIKKKCFVCGSLSHLIRDYDFYEKKMAREVELKKQRVFNTGNGVAKPVWNNANRVNHANHFVPRPIQLIAVRQNVNSVRPNVNTGRANVNSVRQNVNSVRSNVNTGSFNINTIKAKQPINTSNSNRFSPVRPQ